MIYPIQSDPGSGARPLHYYLTPDLMPDAHTVTSLAALARAPGLAHHVAVLPDVHLKGRNPSPTGTVVVSRDTVLPRAVDTGISCGIRMMRSDIDVAALTVDTLDRLFGLLRASIPVTLHERDVITAADVDAILTDSTAWCRHRYGLDDAELDCIESRGCVTAGDDPDRVRASVPEHARRKGPRCFATLGAGNHFLELQEVVEILEPDLARVLGIAPGKAFFMLHTGSRGLGSKTMKKLCDPELHGAPHFGALAADSAPGLTFVHAVGAATNFGFANRMALTDILRRSVREALADRTLELPLLYDCAHVSIRREPWNGEALWVHRHGASRALPPSRMAEHPQFSITGQPVPIPGSMGHDSYVGVAAEGATHAYCSVNHGAGRVLDKPDAVVHFTQAMVEDEMRSKNIRLYRYGAGNIAEQAPAAFKNVSRIVDAMKALTLARPVARLRPIAVLKG